MSVTPESNKTVSMTGDKAAEGPTPKNEFKKPMLMQKQYFMSPTDAMVSPCTQKLQTSRLLPRKPLGNKPQYMLATSKLADKENEKRVAPVISKKAPIEEDKESSPASKPSETIDV